MVYGLEVLVSGFGVLMGISKLVKDIYYVVHWFFGLFTRRQGFLRLRALDRTVSGFGVAEIRASGLYGFTFRGCYRTVSFN